MVSSAQNDEEKKLIEKIKKRVTEIEEKRKVGVEKEVEESSGEKKFLGPEIKKTPLIKKEEGSEDSLKVIYKSFEDKWYHLLDKIDEFVPIYKVIDPIDSAVPSFPLFVGLFLLLIIGGLLLIFLWSFGPLFVFGQEYSFITVQEDGAIIEGVSLNVLSGEKSVDVQSDEFGEFKVELPDETAIITANKEGFLEYQEELTISTESVTEIVMIKEALEYSKKTLHIYAGSEFFRGLATVTFSCSNPNAVDPRQETTTNGIVADISAPENCGTLSFRIVTDRYKDAEGQFGTTSPLSVTLHLKDTPKGEILARVINSETGIEILDINLELYKQNHALVESKKTGPGGYAVFDDLNPGTYYFSASQLATFTDIVQSEPVIVEADEQTEFTLELVPFSGELKKILGKMIDDNTRQPIANVSIKLIVGNHLNQNPFISGEDGMFEILNLEGDSYGLFTDHEDYIHAEFYDVSTVDESKRVPETFKLKKATNENSGDVEVVVKDSDGNPIEGEQVLLYNEDWEIPLEGTTENDGTVVFSNQPPGEYYATAETDTSGGESEKRTLQAGSSITLRIDLITAEGGLKVKVINKTSGAGIEDARVSIIKHGTLRVYDSLITHSNGETNEISLKVMQSVVARVESVEGFVSPVTSSAVTIIEGVTKTILIELREGDLESQDYSISFEKILNMNESSATEFDELNDYKLEFSFTIPKEIEQGFIVVRTQADEPISIFGSHPIGVGTYYDCANSADPFGSCTPTVANPGESTAQQVIIKALAGIDTLDAGEYFFSVSVRLDDIATPTEDVTVSYKLKAREVDAISDEFDPDSGLHPEILTINGSVDCSGEECDVFKIRTNVEFTDGTPVSATGDDSNPYNLNLTETYNLIVSVENLSGESQNGLTLEVRGQPITPGGSDPYLGFSSPPALVYSEQFHLPIDFPQDSFTIDASPLADVDSLLVKIKLVDRDEGGSEKQIYFQIVGEEEQLDELYISNRTTTLWENSEETVTINAKTSRNGKTVEGAAIKMQALAVGQNTTLPSNPSDEKFTTSLGNATFTISDTGEAGRQYCFIGIFGGVDSEVLCLPVEAESVTGFFAPTGILDCVKVTNALGGNDLLFALGLGYTDDSIVVSTEDCDDDVKLAFGKIDATRSIRVIEGRDKTVMGKDDFFSEWDGLLRKNDGRRVFKVDISKGRCRKVDGEMVTVPCSTGGRSCYSENMICPGEYILYVTARFQGDEAFGKPYNLVENGEFKIHAIQGGVEKDYCFEICTNGPGCSMGSLGAEFDLTGSPGGTAKNLCAPGEQVEDIFFPALNLDTCPNEACTDRQARNYFGSLTFQYNLTTHHLEKNPLDGSWISVDSKTGPNKTATITSLSEEVFFEPRVIGKFNEIEHGNAFVLFSNYDGVEDHLVYRTFQIISVTSPPMWLELGFEPHLTLYVLENNNIVAMITGDDFIEGPNYPFEVENYAIEYNKGGLLDVFDFVEVERPPVGVFPEGCGEHTEEIDRGRERVWLTDPEVFIGGEKYCSNGEQGCQSIGRNCESVFARCGENIRLFDPNINCDTPSEDFGPCQYSAACSPPYFKDQQRFHVIFNAGEENACVGHNGLVGASGEGAVDSLRRDFSWRWKSSTGESARALDFCSPQKFEPAEANKEYVYCDGVQFNQMVLERILAIEEEYDEGTPNYEKLARLQNFSAALIVDGYGEDFLNDFKAYKNDTGAFGSGAPIDLFGIVFDYEKFVDAGKFLYEISCDPKVEGPFMFGCGNSDKILPTSGFYDVEIDIEFDSGSTGNFLNNREPTAEIIVHLELKDEIVSDNLLYFIPFDGGIGKNPNTNELERNKYGVDYSGDVIKLFEEGQQGAFETLNSVAQSSALFKLIVNDFSTKSEEDLFKALNRPKNDPAYSRGVVFELFKNTEESATSSVYESVYDMHYSPGYAAPVLMELTRDQGEKVEGFYALNLYSQTYASYGSITGASWSGIASSTGSQTCKDFSGNNLFKDQPALDKSTFSGTQCSLNSNIPNSDAFGFALGKSDYSSSGEKVVFETIVFTPRKEGYSLTNACERNSQATFYSMDSSTSETRSSISLGGAASFPFDPNDPNPIHSVADMFEGVKEEHPAYGSIFCIYTQPDRMEIWFNEKGIRDRIIGAKSDNDGPLYGLNSCVAR